MNFWSLFSSKQMLGGVKLTMLVLFLFFFLFSIPHAVAQDVSECIPEFSHNGQTVQVEGGAQIEVEVLGTAITYKGETVSVTSRLELISDKGTTTSFLINNGEPVSGGEINYFNTDSVTTFSVTANAQLDTRYFFEANSILMPDQFFIVRDGEPCPDNVPFENQTSIQEFASYLIDGAGYAVLEDNQVMIGAELGTTDPSMSSFDLQDLMLLVTFAYENPPDSCMLLVHTDCVPFSSSEVSCDDIDDDCNGEIDENNVCIGYCGDGIQQEDEECDGTDGLTSDNQWCCEGCMIHEKLECPDGQTAKPNTQFLEKEGGANHINHVDPYVCMPKTDECQLAEETCDGIDNDCDGETDEEYSSPTGVTPYDDETIEEEDYGIPTEVTPPDGDETVEEDLSTDIPACSTIAPTLSEAETATDCHPSLEEVNDYTLGKTNIVCGLEVYDYDEDNGIFFFVMADETLCTQSVKKIETGLEMKSGAGCSLNRSSSPVSPFIGLFLFPLGFLSNI